MSYQVIARKYRPQRFADVVGQEHVTQTLANAIVQQRIAHAYLFCGPRGTGKTTIARIFAKCLNCTGGPKVDFDDSDPRCQEITEGRSLDVLEIDGASNNGVEQVRELRDTVKYAPASSKYKIYIIDEVHMLTTQAFNALLKTLEEPPEHVKFMFATTDPEKVLPTILSRCQRFDLRRIPVSLITEHLRHIAAQEKVQIDPEALHAIARGADGGMRDAESALDQLISFCGEQIAESDVLSMFGLTARSQILALAHAVFTGEPVVALSELNELARHGKDLGRLLSDLLNHCRNLLIYLVSKGDLKLLEISEAEAVSLKEQTGLVTADSLTRVMEVFTDAEGRLRDAASKKIFIEVTLLRAMQARQAVSIDEVLKSLNQMRQQGGASNPNPGSQPSPSPNPKTASPTAATAAPASAAPPISRPAPVAPSAPPAPAPTVSAPTLPTSKASERTNKLSAGTETASVICEVAVPTDLEVKREQELTENLGDIWREILEGVGRASPFAKNYLIEAHPISLTKNLLTIGFDPEFSEHIDLVNNQKTHGLLQTKLSELGRPHMQVKFIRAERPVDYVPAPIPALEPERPATPAPPVSAKVPPVSGPAPAGGAKKLTEKPAPAVVNLGDFKNDPLIQKALELFKGRIVEVRA